MKIPILRHLAQTGHSERREVQRSQSSLLQKQCGKQHWRTEEEVTRREQKRKESSLLQPASVKVN